MTYVPGIGAIPESWQIKRAKWVLTLQRRTPRSQDEVVTAFRDGQVTLRSNRRLDGFTESTLEIGYQGIRVGDLVVHSMDGFAGAIGVAEADGKASPVVHAYTTTPNANPRYLAYILRQMAIAGFISSLAKGIRERSTSFDTATLADIEIPLPPIEEQWRITHFLDAEVARIDAAMEAIEHQAMLLTERRLRVLDLAADSANKPRTFHLGYSVNLVTSGSRGWSAYVSNTGDLFFRSANLQRNSIDANLSSVTHVSLPKETMSEARRARIQCDDILIGITGANAGWATLANDEVADGFVSQHVALIRPDPTRIDSEWLTLLISSPTIQHPLMGSQYGGTKTQLSLPDVRKIQVPAIPLERQRELARNIQHRVGIIERQHWLRRRQLELLAERRQVLIVAAITGKFDVSAASGRGVMG